MASVRRPKTGAAIMTAGAGAGSWTSARASRRSGMPVVRRSPAARPSRLAPRARPRPEEPAQDGEHDGQGEEGRLQGLTLDGVDPGGEEKKDAGGEESDGDDLARAHRGLRWCGWLRTV